MITAVHFLSLALLGGEVDLLAGQTFDAFKPNRGDWYFATSVQMDPKNPKLLAGERGGGTIIVNGGGKTTNIVTKQSFGDCELECEFMMPKGSNAGLKLHAHYEIQMFDSYGVKKLRASDCGGVYHRSESKPYHHIDSGIPPLVNASKPPGEWQKMTIRFRAPRFDAAGRKTEKAKFEKVTLNGTVVQDNVTLHWPTGNAWRNREMTKGPILVQADHGPVAFRKLAVRELSPQ